MVMKLLACGTKIDNPSVMISIRIRLFYKNFLAESFTKKERNCRGDLLKFSKFNYIFAISIDLWSCLILLTTKFCQAKLVK